MRPIKNYDTPRIVNEYPFSKATRRVYQSPVRKILAAAAHPEIISLAVGSPASGMFPREAWNTATAEAMRPHGATQYGEPHRALKEHIVELMDYRGVHCSVDQIFLTSGAQQGLSLVNQLLVDPQRAVITEDTVYDCLQMVLQTFGARAFTVPTCAESGMDLDSVQHLLESRINPAYLYTITDGHNPRGVSMSRENRERLIELVQHFEVPIIEDDAYGFLYYENEGGLAPLRALDDRWVFYLGSFSKILAPTLRLGWIVVPQNLTPSLQDLTSKLSILKQAIDFDTATFVQRAVSAFLDTDGLPAHIQALRGAYRERRDAMLEALMQHLPDGVRWNRPKSGFFIWLELPAGIDGYELLETAIATEKVAFAPGRAFAMHAQDRSFDHCLRLSFSNSTPEEIHEAVARLGRVLRRAMAERRSAADQLETKELTLRQIATMTA